MSFMCKTTASALVALTRREGLPRLMSRSSCRRPALLPARAAEPGLSPCCGAARICAPMLFGLCLACGWSPFVERRAYACGFIVACVCRSAMCRRSVALICASPRGVLSGVRMIVERRAYARRIVACVCRGVWWRSYARRCFLEPQWVFVWRADDRRSWSGAHMLGFSVACVWWRAY